MNKAPSNDITHHNDIAEQAAHWVEKMDGGELSPDSNKQFLYWLKSSPLHVNEFIQACVLFDATELVDQYKDIAAEVSWTSKAHIKQYPNSGAVTANRARHARFASKWFYSLAIVALVFLTGSVYLYLPDLFSRQEASSPLSNVYSTGLGEFRSVLLDDGTLVNLNTLTTIDVHYSDDFRDIHLLSGEALFNVAKQPDRPLRVKLKSVVAQANGSELNVKLGNNNTNTQTSVTVVSGNVAVSENWQEPGLESQFNSARNQQANTVQLGLGEEVVLNQQGLVQQRQRINLTQRLAWTQKKLIFNGESLQEVANEFNRYNKLFIEIADDNAASIPISGVFTTDHPETLIEFLQSSGELKVDETQRNRVVVRSVE